MSLVKIAAKFSTTLAAKIEAADTSMVLSSILSGTGANLPAGVYGFVIDEGTTEEEFVVATIATTTTLTSMLRGVSHLDGVTEITALKKPHRRGSEVKITDHVAIQRIIRIIDGTDPFPAGAVFGGGATFAGNVAMGGFKITGLGTPTLATDAVTKGYADALTYAGAPDGAEDTKGLYELATAAESEAGDDSGTTSAPLVVRPSHIAANIQSGTFVYGESAVGTDSYKILLTPTVTAYTKGMTVLMLADVANTGACTLELESLGAKPIKKLHDQALENNDIEAGQIVILTYDGVNFQLQNQVATDMTSAQSDTLTGGATSDASALHAHETPSLVAGETVTAGQAVFIGDGAAVAWERAQRLRASAYSNFDSTNVKNYQTFFTHSNGVNAITRVEGYFQVGGGAPTGDVTVTIYAVDGAHKPTGAALGSATATNANVALDAPASTFTVFDFAAPVSLSANTEYALVFSVSAGTGANFWTNYYTTTVGAFSGYTGVSADGGSTWSSVVNHDAIAISITLTVTFTTDQFYLSKADFYGSAKFDGFVQANTTVGNSGAVALGRIAGGSAALTAGNTYYVSDTAGTLATTPGTIIALAGRAITTTSLLVDKGTKYACGRFDKTDVATSDQQIRFASGATRTWAIGTGFYPKVIHITGFMNGSGAGGSADATIQDTVSAIFQLNYPNVWAEGAQKVNSDYDGVAGSVSVPTATYLIGANNNAGESLYLTITALTSGGFTLSFTQDAGDGNMWTVNLFWEAWG